MSATLKSVLILHYLVVFFIIPICHTLTYICNGLYVHYMYVVISCYANVSYCHREHAMKQAGWNVNIHVGIQWPV